jgi:NADPH2:quinone reductase
MARIVRFHELGGPEVLKIEDVAVSPPGSGEVSIAVRALGLNRADELFREGRYQPAPVFPSRIGYEAAGTVTALGGGTNGLAVGDVVSVIPIEGGIGRYGTYGEVATVPATAVVKHPPSLTFEEAAATWMQYLTAYGALFDIARLGKGDFVAITAASSSVGLAAIQLARLVGAIPIATTRTGTKRDALLGAGAVHVIATAEEDIGGRLAEITGGKGVRVVFDSVGGSNVQTFVDAMARHGVYVLYGLLDRNAIVFQPGTFLYKALTFTTFRNGDLTTDSGRLEAALRFLLEPLASGKLKPVIAHTFTLDRIVEAHRYLASNRQFGKIVVTV